MTIASGVLSRKLDRIFRFLDADGDGELRPEDVTVLAARLAGAFDAPGDRPKIDALERALAEIVRTDVMPMDADGNGGVDIREFGAGFRHAIDNGPEAMLSRFDVMVDAWMNLADSNGDGVIDQAEFTRMYTMTLGVPADDLAIAFAKLDRDGNGTLDREEIRTATREYYTSDDPAAPGNWLFGPM
ncbi:Ca2+-binding EF-hand superfamily protein [Nocardia transvalensis]|uniref:Ca2+-binding EF-hand superfamily protein n=1 Tax=Nocardia transvalensis TaxID=37333 RepID=A0A7W9PFQ3_9NOCA|nr:EF-hand domain-containing protein [Nocardia transvalensis]MBB5914783.1 Ca2+-binding EF-hand superfamily protein [Nocardia transvalensis]